MYSNETERANYDINDDFKLKMVSIQTYLFALRVNPSTSKYFQYLAREAMSLSTSHWILLEFVKFKSQ